MTAAMQRGHFCTEVLIITLLTFSFVRSFFFFFLSKSLAFRKIEHFLVGCNCILTKFLLTNLK